MDIARVEDLLDTLKEERNDEDFLIAQHKRLIGRVHTLPPEIMLVIFRYCLDPNLPPDIPSHPSYTLYGRGKPIPWVLSVVCSRWRCILRESPSMWASFNVKADTALPFLEDALRLSGHGPLHFNLYLSYTDKGTYIQTLVEHVARWESVHIDVLLDAFVGLGRLDHLPMQRAVAIHELPTAQRAMHHYTRRKRHTW